MRLLCTSLLLLYSIFLCAQEDKTGWFAFAPEPTGTRDALDLSHWLDKPAGKHGFLRYDGKDFFFDDGTPVKFWGVNIAGNRPFMKAEHATRFTRFMAKYGINGVRFHKFTWDATDGFNSTVITNEKWKNLDFFCKELRDAGIYYSWSHIYGHRVRPGDSSRLVAYTEVANTEFPWSHLNGSTASLVNFAEDLQQLNIELTVNMLNHVNPHTGKRYADDPALTFVELQNEDNIFWGAMEATLKQTPTYREMLMQKFSDWLKEKYKAQEALEKAWNGLGLDDGASLMAGDIYPNPSHGYFSSAYEKAVEEKQPVPRHVTDRAAFLYEEQMKFYTKFIKAIRDTGYKGVIIGSCWQAGSGISHFFNLHTDYLAGPIDRHNYFGGGRGHRLQPGKFNNTAMVSNPGSGLLSTGFQQVVDRPFLISEWMSLIPTEWTGESSPLIAAYGMGLQGWDASYAFAMDLDHFAPTIQSYHGVYNVTSPTQLGLYPALVPMVYRGDVREGDVIANRNVNIIDLRDGEINFIEKTSQQYDIKRFESSVPMEALAIGRVTVSFDGTEKDFQKKLGAYWDKNKKLITSVTGQLQWSYAGKGYSTINTAGTKGLIGFASGVDFRLGDVRFRTPNEFAVVLITSLEKDSDLASAKRILVTTVARAQNTGMKFNADKTELFDVGKSPILMEPVDLTLQLTNRRNGTVYVLDHSGYRTDQTMPLRNGKVVIEGEKTRSIYYEIVFD